MEPAAMLAQLTRDGAALEDAAARAGLEAAVPSCPGWTVRDAVEHTAMVYAHKSTVIEGGYVDGPPPGWPPSDLGYDDVLEFYDAQLHRVIEALRTRDPLTTVWTWYEPDQSIGFWVRRMMQETVIHRADVELAAGEPAPIDDEVAVDGIDELLDRMLRYDVEAYAETPGSGQRVAVRPDGARGWTVTLAPQTVVLDTGAAGGADATITGAPGRLLLALWNRLPYDAVGTSGDPGALAALRTALANTTQ